MLLTRVFIVGGLALGAISPIAHAECAAPAKGPAAKPSKDDPAAVSAAFWTDWKKTEASESYVALKAAVAKTQSAPVANAGKTQRIVDVAISKPADAAKVMSEATAVSSDAPTANALSTVMNMTTSPKTREEAAAYVAPEAKERVETWQANLSTGIQGLPGVYLGDNAVTNGGERQPAPVGYTPVSGGAAGCPTR